ncbi:MAG: hypothetical protein QXI12_05745 [Candidatus Methanomethyliaceae archaeon]
MTSLEIDFENGQLVPLNIYFYVPASALSYPIFGREDLPDEIEGEPPGVRIMQINVSEKTFDFFSIEDYEREKVRKNPRS